MKKHTFTVLFIFSMGASLCQNLDSLLLLHYPFTGNANDASGNGYHGTVYNATLTEDNHGNPNQAYYFNGIDSYIEFPNNYILKPPLPLSFSFWFKFDTLELQFLSILTTDYAINTYTGIWFNLDHLNSTISLSFGDGSPNSTGPYNRRTIHGTTVLQTETWYFIIGVIRGATDMDLYVNCTNENGNYSGTGGSLAYSSSPGVLGRIDQKLQDPYYFKGSLDKIRYWARALTPDDITVLCDPASIEHLASDFSEQLLVFPNPVDNILYIEPTMPLGFFRYRIVNILGKIIDSGIVQQDEPSEIQISEIPSGVYVIIVNDGVKEHSARFIKQ